MIELEYNFYRIKHHEMEICLCRVVKEQVS